MKNFFKSKLKLNKETVTKLNKAQMNGVVGGAESKQMADSIAAAGIDTAIDTARVTRPGDTVQAH